MLLSAKLKTISGATLINSIFGLQDYSANLNLPRNSDNHSKVMTFVVTSACIGVKDRSCVEVCPVDCFYDLRRPSLNNRFKKQPPKITWENDSFVRLEGEEYSNTNLDWGLLAINPDECINCGACVVECPVSAIYEDIEVPEPEQLFIQINAEVASWSAEALNKARVLKKP